jgi:hypothetical protein
MEPVVIAAAAGLAVGVVLGVGLTELWHRAEEVQQHRTIMDTLVARLDAMHAPDDARRRAVQAEKEG